MIYQENRPMKALIVDDETHVIEAIELLLPWNELGVDSVLTAASVPDARHLLEKERPELAFVDIMVGQNLGLELMDYIVENHLITRVIAVSGYSDFEYVRQMLINGAVDYLLKPLNRSALLTAARKAIAQLKEFEDTKAQEQSLNQKLTYLSAERQRTLFEQLFHKATFAPAYKELKSIIPKLSSASHCRIYTCLLDFYPCGEKAFSENLQIFCDAVHRQLELDACGTLILTTQPGPQLFIFLYDAFEKSHIHIQRALLRLRGAAKWPLHLGYSRICSMPNHFQLACKSAENAFLDAPADLMPEPLVACAAESAGQAVLGTDEFMESQIVTSILMGSPQMIRENTDAWVSFLFSGQPFTLLTIQKVYGHFHSLYSRWTQQLSRKYPDFAPADKLAVPKLSSFLDEGAHYSILTFKEICGESFLNLSSLLHSSIRSHSLPYLVLDYMDLNFSQPFSQTEYAKLFNVSKEYLCRKFKEAHGVSMVTYLNQLRINRAKELLCTTDCSISDIASQVGYDDDKYFSTLFKKFTSVSPSRYRHSFEKDSKAY